MGISVKLLNGEQIQLVLRVSLSLRWFKREGLKWMGEGEKKDERRPTNLEGRHSSRFQRWGPSPSSLIRETKHPDGTIAMDIPYLFCDILGTKHYFSE